MQTDPRMDRQTDKLTGLPKDRSTDWISFRYARPSRFGEVKKKDTDFSQLQACVGTPLQTLKGADISHDGFFLKI